MISGEETTLSQHVASDAPLSRLSQDQLGRSELAHRLAEYLAHPGSTDSTVVAIYGPWGSGKTTLLHFVKELLKPDVHVVQVEFNPWQVGNEELLLKGFFATMAGALKQHETGGGRRVAKAVVALLSYAEPIAELAYGSSAGNALRGAKGILARLSEASMAERRTRLNDALRSSEMRVVVFMDDVDRLDKEEICALLKLVKLVADFDNVTYVLACDEDMVARAVGRKYAGADELEAGRSFLEKIVQIPFRLPSPNSFQLATIALDGIRTALKYAGISLTKYEGERLRMEFDRGLLAGIMTPRTAKRIQAAVSPALILLRGEVNAVDTVLLEGMRVVYPGLYTGLLSEPEAVLPRGVSHDLKEWQGEAVEKWLKTVEPHSARLAASRLLSDLFPGLDEDDAYRSEAYSLQQRVASNRFFERYAHQAVPPNDIPDRTVVQILAIAGTSEDETAALIGSALTSLNSRVFVARLTEESGTLDSPAALNLLTLLFHKFGSRLPEALSFSVDDASHPTQVARLAVSLLERIQAGSGRNVAAKDLLSAIPSDVLAIQCLTWLQNRPDKNGQRPLFEPETMKDLAAIVLERIVSTCRNNAPVYLRLSLDAETLLLAWDRLGDHESMCAYVRHCVGDSVDEAMALIWSFCQSGQVNSSSYEMLCRVIDPHHVGEILSKAGLGIGTTPDGGNESDNADDSLAAQFISYCERDVAS